MIIKRSRKAYEITYETYHKIQNNTQLDSLIDPETSEPNTIKEEEISSTCYK